MYMLGENPFLSDPNINKVRKALSALDFLVVQDIFLTETAEFADVILPASSYLEKDGTYTNTDRRVQLGRKVLDPPGQARVDWEVVQDIANRIGLGWEYGIAAGGLRGDRRGDGQLYEPELRQPRACPASSTRTLTRSTPTAPWSCSARRFKTDDGLAHLVPAEWLPAKELPSEEYPVIVSTPAGCCSTGTPAR